MAFFKHKIFLFWPFISKRPRMKRLTALLLLAGVISLPSFAGIKFIEGKTWKEVLAMAKKENKLIFLDAYATWCGPCKFLQKNVFTDRAVGEFYNSNFVNVAMDMEAGEGPELAQTLGLSSYPTLFFIDGDGKVLHKSIGAMESAAFISLGKDARDPQRQYYTVKAGIPNGQMDPALVHAWAEKAGTMEDEELVPLVDAYLGKSTRNILDKDLLSLVLGYATTVSREQIDLIYNNRLAAAKSIGSSEEAIDDALLGLVRNYALSRTTAEGRFDGEAFKKLIAQYYPDKAAYVTGRTQFDVYMKKEESAKALSLLSSMMGDKTYGLPVSEMALMMIDATNAIVAGGQSSSWIAKVEAFPVAASEKDESFYKDLALMMIYYRTGEGAKVESFGRKILKTRNVPDQIQELVKSLIGE